MTHRLGATPHLKYQMSADPSTRLRLAAIDFLNPAPLLYDFEHEPTAIPLRSRYQLTYTSPAQCAEQMGGGDADLGLVPIGAMPYISGLAVVPGCTIASLHKVRSIQLAVRPGLNLATIRTVAADSASRSSAAYVQIILRAFYDNDPAFVRAPADLPAMLGAHDAALLIGDPALLALDRRDGPAAMCREAVWFDVAELWHRHTGLPWVAAVWSVRLSALTAKTATRAQLIADLTGSRDSGTAHIPAIVKEWKDRIDLSPATIAEYLTGNIHYTLDDSCLRAMRRFYELGSVTGVLPEYDFSLL